jgi:hypothetical protein
MKIHDTFHTSLLRFAFTNFLTNQIQSSSSSVVINEKEEYEVDDILNSRYHYEKLRYKVVWIDHFSNRAWYSAKNFQNHFKEILIDYHQRYSNKFISKLRLIVLIKSITKHFYWLQQAKNLMKDTFNKMQIEMKKNKQYLALINSFDRH